MKKHPASIPLRIFTIIVSTIIIWPLLVISVLIDMMNWISNFSFFAVPSEAKILIREFIKVIMNCLSTKHFYYSREKEINDEIIRRTCMRPANPVDEEE